MRKTKIMIHIDGKDDMAMRISENQILSIRDWPDGRQVVAITDAREKLEKSGKPVERLEYLQINDTLMNKEKSFLKARLKGGKYPQKTK